MQKKITVIVVDDHTLMRNGLKALLSSEKDICVIGEAESGEAAIKIVSEKKPDVILMDIKMPGMGGVEAISRIMRTVPGARIIAVTSYDADPHPTELLKLGIAGFLAKDCSSTELIDAIHHASQYRRYISAAVAQALVAQDSTGARKLKKGQQADSPLSGLSKREKQVLTLLGSGLDVPQIADTMRIAPKTVNTYRYRLYKKLNVVTDVELSHIAIRYKLVDIDARKIA